MAPESQYSCLRAQLAWFILAAHGRHIEPRHQQIGGIPWQAPRTRTTPAGRHLPHHGHPLVRLVHDLALLRPRTGGGQASFDSTATVRTPGGWLIRGLLTARGTTAPVDLTVVTARADDQGLAIEAEGRVDRYAHGITLMKGIAARHVDLPIAVLAVPA